MSRIGSFGKFIVAMILAFAIFIGMVSPACGASLFFVEAETSTGTEYLITRNGDLDLTASGISYINTAGEEVEADPAESILDSAEGWSWVVETDEASLVVTSTLTLSGAVINGDIILGEAVYDGTSDYMYDYAVVLENSTVSVANNLTATLANQDLAVSGGGTLKLVGTMNITPSEGSYSYAGLQFGGGEFPVLEVYNSIGAYHADNIAGAGIYIAKVFATGAVTDTYVNFSSGSVYVNGTISIGQEYYGNAYFGEAGNLNLYAVANEDYAGISAYGNLEFFEDFNLNVTVEKTGYEYYPQYESDEYIFDDIYDFICSYQSYAYMGLFDTHYIIMDESDNLVVWNSDMMESDTVGISQSEVGGETVTKLYSGTMLSWDYTDLPLLVEEYSQAEDEKEDSGGSNIAIDPSYTVGGQSEASDDGDGEDGDGVECGDDTFYYASGKYIEDEYFASAEEAEKAQAENDAKEGGEEAVGGFASGLTDGLPIEADDVDEKYSEEISQIEEGENGYEYGGESYGSIEEAVSAVVDKVNRDIFADCTYSLADLVRGWVHLCDSEIMQGKILGGSSAISELEYDNADKLSEIYREALDSIAVGEKANTAVASVVAVYQKAISGGLLTDESLVLIEEAYEKFIGDIASVEDASEIEELEDWFYEYLALLAVKTVGLYSADGGAILLVSNSEGIGGDTQISYGEVADIAGYDEMVKLAIENGSLIDERGFSLFGDVGSAIDGMDVVAVLDISISESYADDGSVVFKVKVALPDGLENMTNVQIVHVHEGVMYLIDGVIENGYLVFETFGFSEFIIYAKVGVSLWYIFIPLGVIGLLGMAYFMLGKKRKGEENGV